MMATPYPMEIIQLPEQKRIIMIFEGATHIWREIYMDGRPHPAGRRARTRRISVTRSAAGKATRSSSTSSASTRRRGSTTSAIRTPTMLHVVERFSRPNKSTLHYEATVDDPGALHEAVHGARGTFRWNAERRAGRIHLPGEQQAPAAADGRLRPADLRQEAVA